MKYIPLFIDFTDRKVLFVGGGKVAERKIALFDGSKAIITVISPTITEKIEELKQKNRINVLFRKASVKDINKDYFIVYTASNDKELNSQIAKQCANSGILCNRCDNADESTFINGATVNRGEITVAINSGGVPVISQYIKHKTEETITPEVVQIAKLAKELREENKNDTCKIYDLIAKQLNNDSLLRIKNGNINDLKQEILECL